MKCYACKTDIRDEDSFCKKCGSPQRFTKLINQALQKDQEALAWLYKMTYNNVYHTICAVAKLDDDIVFDLIQDIYIKAFQNLSQLMCRHHPTQKYLFSQHRHLLLFHQHLQHLLHYIPYMWLS